ncbi:MAG TPA: DUF3179 domain-containing protein [Anaerolineales bacterium]|nr:DUF3179 domain-containing protein [Anaerolineales bacterium]
MKTVTRSFILLVFLTSACAPAITQTPTQTPAMENVVEDPLPTSTQEPMPTSTNDIRESPPRGAESEFSTDFTKHSIPYSDVLSGGPPKDGIPAIDDPKYVSISEADKWLRPIEPVVSVEVNGQGRAYPIQVLMWHEIVNDNLNGEPLTITFCPLCNTAIGFKRMVDGQVLDFGTTGRLRFSNLIMYDRQTETWWQQATGEAIVGELLGTKLEFYPAAIVSWESFKSQYPEGDVLSTDTGHGRNYGRNPYFGYDDVNSVPFLYKGAPTPDQLAAVDRVLTIDLNGEAVAYPYKVLKEVHVVNDTVGDEEIVVFWQAGVASALDTSQVATGRDVGTGAAFSRNVDGQVLTFTYDGTLIKDEETNSTWNIFGEAIDGKLKGTQLSPTVAINHFWFSWAAFKPETRIYQP